MAINLQDAAQFSIEGSRFQRNNPDGTLALPSRTVHDGKATFDMSGYAGEIGVLTFKEDAATPVNVNIDASGEADPAAVTKAEMVALLDAALTDYTVTLEVATGLILIVYSGAGNPSYVQFYGEMAGTLGLGGTAESSALGTKIKKFFNSVTSLARAKNMKEGEEIEAEGGDGTLWVVRTSSIMKGENVTFNMLEDDDEFKELVMGGVYTPASGTYAYPNTDQTIQPKFRQQSFIPKYGEGTQDRADIKGYSQVDHFSCTGIEGDISNEAKAWATLAYNISVLEWFNAAGVKQSSVEKKDLSVAEYMALDVKNV